MPVTFVSRMRFQSASLISTDGTRLVTPAATTTMSTWPKAARHASRSAAIDSTRATSTGCRSVRRPSRSMTAATSSTTSARRPVATTSAPASANPSAIARPMPDVPPTTTAVRPVRSNRDGVTAREEVAKVGSAIVLSGDAWDRRLLYRCSWRKFNEKQDDVMDVPRLAVLAAVAMTVLPVSGATSPFDSAQGKQPVAVTPNESAKRVDIAIGGKPFTSYLWPDQVKKPVLD